MLYVTKSEHIFLGKDEKGETKDKKYMEVKEGKIKQNILSYMEQEGCKKKWNNDAKKQPQKRFAKNY